MHTIQLRQKADADEILRFGLSASAFNASEFEVLVVLQPLQKTESTEVDKMGYPLGYFEETYGSLADAPIEHGEQPSIETKLNETL